MTQNIRSTSSAVLLSLALVAAACGQEQTVTTPGPAQGQDESPMDSAVAEVAGEFTEQVGKAAAEKAGEVLGEAMTKRDGPAVPKPPVAKAGSGAAPQFALPDLDGKQHELSDYAGQWVVLEWINHGCPFVKRLYDAGTMPALQAKYAAKGVVWLSMCSSGEGKQGYHEPDKWKEINTKKGGKATAVLLDPAGDVGRLFGAKTTPHMFVIDPQGAIVYQGAIDDDPRGKSEAPTNYVSAVLDAGLAGRPAPYTQTKAYG